MEYRDSKKILVVDDSLDTLELLQRNLTQAGYTVFSAPGVHEAMDVLEDNHVDLVITDFQMPLVSGLELCRNLKKHPITTETPALMLTARGFTIGAESCIFQI